MSTQLLHHNPQGKMLLRGKYVAQRVTSDMSDSSYAFILLLSETQEAIAGFDFNLLLERKVVVVTHICSYTPGSKVFELHIDTNDLSIEGSGLCPLWAEGARKHVHAWSEFHPKNQEMEIAMALIITIRHAFIELQRIKGAMCEIRIPCWLFQVNEEFNHAICAFMNNKSDANDVCLDDTFTKYPTEYYRWVKHVEE